MGRKIQMACAWTGPLLVALWGFGAVVFAHIIPANTPQRSVADVVGSYTGNLTGIRIGMAMIMFGSGLLIPWGISLATQTRRASPDRPILFHIQVACSVGACMLGVMICLAGGLAAFRPGQISGEITQLLNDVMWFCWVIPGSYFEVWCIVVAVAILGDRAARPVFPRWSGYFNIFVACSYVPGFMGLFFKSGPFAYNGLFVWWIPTVMFFFWILPMTALTIRAIRNEPEPSGPSVGQIGDPAVVAEFARLRAEIAARVPEATSAAQ
jgi:hypothetical protein